jgi:LmbE family N-acetylglucosaminyl deacetylase
MLDLFLDATDIVCLSPHPDDCEYAVSGTISKYYDTTFYVINISSGGKYSSYGDQRIEEVKKFWSSYDNVELIFLGVDFIRDVQCDSFISKIEKILYPDCSPSIILTPSFDDTHQDHRKINEIANSLTRSKKIGLVEYMTPSTKIGWVPNMFVDINEHIKIKKENLFNSFKTQLDKPYFTDKVFDSYHCNYQTMKRDLDNVEFFKVGALYQ